MKALGFVISLLVHLLVLLLLVQVRFSMIEVPARTQIIQIVPMSPPLPVEPPARPPVYVRPFVLKGGAPGHSRYASSAGGAATEAALPETKASPRRAPRPTGAPSPAGNGTPEAAAGTTPEPPGKKGRHLDIDPERLSRTLRERGIPPRPAFENGFPTGAEKDGLPFNNVPSVAGSPPGGSGGDSTVGTAFGGHAFFDSRGYDITPWARRMVYRVKKNWIFRPLSLYGLKGTVGIYLLIERDGTVSKIYIRKTSAIRPMDQAAFNAISLSVPLPPLPDDFPYMNLPAYLLFFYN